MSDGDNKTPSTHDVQGEGDYEAARRYDKSTEEFAKSGKVEQAARDAAPASDAEAESMRRAEEEGRSHSKGEGSTTGKKGDAGR